MYIIPRVHITVVTAAGQTIEFTSTNDVYAKRSIYSLVETGMVKVPTSAVLVREGEAVTQSVQTASQFNPGDAIEIKLGYDTLVTEFKGFIHRINFTAPCEIECEGWSYKLKRTKNFYKHWKNVTVKTILNTLIEGTGITLHKDTQDITVDRFELNGENALEAIEKLKKQGELVAAYFINHNELYAGTLLGALRGEEVLYRLQYNTINDGDLRYRDAESQKVKYNLSYSDAKGKVHHTSFGDDGGVVINCGNMGYVGSAELAKLKAKKTTASTIYEGYEGRLQTFLEPYAAPGMTGVITGDNYKKREGSFIITETEVRLNRQGGRRFPSIGAAVNWLQEHKV